MAVSGPKPKPSRGRTRAHDDDKLPTPVGQVGALVEAPSQLTPEAREVWLGFVPFLAEHGALLDVDETLMVELCEAVVIAKTYRHALQEGIREGVAVFVDRNGGEHQVPFLGSPVEKNLRIGWKDSLSKVERLAEQFGMTPVARTRLGLMTLKGRSLLDEVRSLGGREGK